MWHIKSKISKLRASARRRGLKVRLMEYEYESLLNLGCHYCGKEVLSENGYCLDRLDSKKDYFLHNCVACCKKCNFAKGSMGFIEFIEWIQKAYKHQQQILETLKNLENTEYSYKQEKELHKLVKTEKNDKFIGIS